MVFPSEEMAEKNFDDSYIPVPVLEQSMLAKKSQLDSNSTSRFIENLSEMPSSSLRRGSDFMDPSLRKEPIQGSYMKGPDDPYKLDFYMGRRHTLAYKAGIEECENLQKG